jgi:hypothetical protein
MTFLLDNHFDLLLNITMNVYLKIFLYVAFFSFALYITSTFEFVGGFILGIGIGFIALTYKERPY